MRSKEDAAKIIAERHNISTHEVNEIVNSVYKFARKTITSINFSEMDLDTFSKTKKNFNIPALGKLYINEKAFKKINKLD